jgi:Na+-driven multidrug efflux pump
MYCHKCGKVNDENAWKCTQCGTVLAHDGAIATAAGDKPIPTYFAAAVLVTVFFLPSPVGVVAIWYSLHVRAHLMRGDLEKARKASKQALIWCWISAAVGTAIVLYTAKYMHGYLNKMLQQFQQLTM